MATIKQQRAVKNMLSEDISTAKNALILAGYSESMSKKPSVVTNSVGFLEEAKPIIDQLIRERQRAVSQMQSKISSAKYRDLTESIDKLTKNIQLLSGKATENQAIQVQMIDWNTYKSSK